MVQGRVNGGLEGGGGAGRGMTDSEPIGLAEDWLWDVGVRCPGELPAFQLEQVGGRWWQRRAGDTGGRAGACRWSCRSRLGPEVDCVTSKCGPGSSYNCKS